MDARKILQDPQLTNNVIKELTDFLDKYDVEYKIVEDRIVVYHTVFFEYRVVAEEVILCFNDITQLPESIGYLTCDHLYLNDNKLTSLPDSIVNLQCKSKSLWLDGNKLETLPDNIGELQCKDLTLNNNKLESLPDSFGDLKCEGLYLQDNELTQLPESFENLKCKLLFLNNNPLTSDSIELLEKLKSNGVYVTY